MVLAEVDSERHRRRARVILFRLTSGVLAIVIGWSVWLSGLEMGHIALAVLLYAGLLAALTQLFGTVGLTVFLDRFFVPDIPPKTFFWGNDLGERSVGDIGWIVERTIGDRIVVTIRTRQDDRFHFYSPPRDPERARLVALLRSTAGSLRDVKGRETWNRADELIGLALESPLK